MRNPLTTISLGVLSLCATSGAARADAVTDWNANAGAAALVGQAPVEELKMTYLNCNREALAGRLDRGAIMGCSMVYEALKQKAFGGDFARLLTWSRAQEIASDSLPRTAASRP